MVFFLFVVAPDPSKLALCVWYQWKSAILTNVRLLQPVGRGGKEEKKKVKDCCKTKIRISIGMYSLVLILTRIRGAASMCSAIQSIIARPAAHCKPKGEAHLRLWHRSTLYETCYPCSVDPNLPCERTANVIMHRG